MLVVLTRHFLLTGFVTVTVLVKIPWGVAGVFVMLAGLFLWHDGVPFAALSDSNFLEGAQFPGHLLANTKSPARSAGRASPSKCYFQWSSTRCQSSLAWLTRVALATEHDRSAKLHGRRGCAAI